MKRAFVLSVLMLIACTLFAATGKTVVQAWLNDTQEYHQPVIDDFNKLYPDIEITHTLIPWNDILSKIQTAIVSGTDVPDLTGLEVNVRGSMVDADIWEDLSAPPYNVDKKSLLDYLIPISTDEKGRLVGIEWSPAMAGLAYKRPLAKKYFGTDDPKALEKMFPTWDAFIKKGTEVYQKSNGTVYMFASVGEVVSVLKGQTVEPFIIKDKLNFKKAWGPIFDLTLKMYQSRIIDDLTWWTPAWNVSIKGDNHIFYPCATWGPTWVFKANDKDSMGRWGLMVSPQGSFAMGGTIIGIPAKAKNKDAAFTYLKWVHLTKEGAASKRDHMEFFSSLKSVYDNAQFYSKPDPYFGNQDVLKKFAVDIRKTMLPSRAICKYDLFINDGQSLAITAINANRNTTTNELIAKLEEDICLKTPDLKK